MFSHYELLVRKPPNAAKTTQAIAITPGFPSQLDGRIPLLKIYHTFWYRTQRNES